MLLRSFNLFLPKNKVLKTLGFCHLGHLSVGLLSVTPIYGRYTDIYGMFSGIYGIKTGIYGMKTGIYLLDG